MVDVQVSLPQLADGRMLLASVQERAPGVPRFTLPLSPTVLGDNAAHYLVAHEHLYGGYERPFREFFDAHLQPGDGFIDVGAHWGVFSLAAATRWPRQIAVLALEPLPLNAVILSDVVLHNHRQDDIEVLAVAAGAAAGTAPMLLDSSMAGSLHGHGLRGLGDAERRRRVTVPVLPIDHLLSERPAWAARRLFIKIDVEGFEPEVVAGAEGAIRSGRVAALLWERGRAVHASDERFRAFARMEAFLVDAGFAAYQFEDELMGGALIPCAGRYREGNVLSLSADLNASGRFSRPADKRPP
jgi:FkbM family methyltransferase